MRIHYILRGTYPTGPQKPDNTFSLSKKQANGRRKYRYVFDAKYKMNPALDGTYYKSVFKAPGPEEEDINTMHRYRDAIVSQHDHERPWERLMFGAYVLFPLSGTQDAVEQYKNHIFYKSIKEVNIGGRPFLPSATQLVENLLDDLIGESSAEAEERPPKQLYADKAENLLSLYKQMSTEEKCVFQNGLAVLMNGEILGVD